MRFCEGMRALWLGAALMVGGCAVQGHVSQSTPIAAVNTQDGVALKGYDPVAYVTDVRPVKGDPRFTATWNGATYQFASAEHRDRFLADPGKYAPQYGGYCAFAISRGRIADIDPDQWARVNGKLYLNNNAFAQAAWSVDRPGNIAAGDSNWPLVPKLDGSPAR